MSYKQISSTGSIVSGPNPDKFTSKQIKEEIFNTLNSNDYSFN